MGVTVKRTLLGARCHVIVLAVCLWATRTSPVSGVLETTPAAVNGQLITCTGQPISLTCTHTNTDTGRTTWRFSPPIDCSRSLLHDPVPDNIDDCGPFSFKDVTQLTEGVTQLSSTAVATVSSQHTGTLVECSDRSSVSMTNIGNVSLCVIVQPTNLDIDGTRISWSGPNCVGTTITYAVSVSKADNGQPRIFNVTSGTSATLPDLEPNQMYTVGVSAYGSSCSTQSNVANFMTPDDVRPVTTSSGGGGMSSAESTSDPPSNAPSSAGADVGLAIAIPLLVIVFAVAALVAIILFGLYYKRLRRSKPVVHEYDEINDIDGEQKGNTIKKNNGAPTDKVTIETVDGHQYSELDTLDSPNSQKDNATTEPQKAKQPPVSTTRDVISSVVDKLPSNERADIDPSGPPYPGRRYSEVDKFKKKKARENATRAEADSTTGLEHESESPPLPAPYPTMPVDDARDSEA